jgi:alkylhydroperoxidase family enzyme
MKEKDMTDNSRILTPLPESQWAGELADVARSFKNVLNIHRVIAHNPALMAAYAPLRNYIVAKSSLTPRQRELLILRTAHLLQCDYEWQHHIVRGQAVGITSAEIERLQQDIIDANWSAPEELALLHCADEMFHQQQLRSETAAALQQLLGNEALLDAIYTVGIYITLGTILKTFAVPLEDSLEPLTDDIDTT